MRLFLRLLLFSLLPGLLHADDPRITPAVTLIEKIRPAIVPIFSRAGDSSVGAGTGVVIHEQGYILTADHVTADREGVVIFGLTRVPYKIVGRLPERDLALLKVTLPKPITPIPLGRSHDLRAGEPIVVGGNPGGRGMVFSQGTVNTPSMEPSWPNLLAMTFWRDEQEHEKSAPERMRSPGGRPNFIQFDAMSNKGNSGGALLNIRGELIGIVVQKSTKEEAVNWAIPVDRIRVWWPYFAQPEESGDVWAGLTMDPLANGAQVLDVAPGSPAAKAGIRNGDVIQKIGGAPLGSGADWVLDLFARKPGDSLSLTVLRGAETLTSTLSLEAYPSTPAISQTDRKPGLNFAVYRNYAYRGEANLKDEFHGKTPDDTGNMPAVSVDDLKTREKENFAVILEGYLEFPTSGIHRLWLGADDGARLFVDGRLVIDNGLAHPYQELSRAVRVRQGLVPVRIEYFESRGESRLTLSAGPGDSEADRTSELKLWRDVK